jgi:hypothetical protein
MTGPQIRSSVYHKKRLVILAREESFYSNLKNLQEIKANKIKHHRQSLWYEVMDRSKPVKNLGSPER